MKLVKDPVHGYIAIPRPFVRSFIDTPVFQRLRNIEQTSMRCLFPGAHHDRFIHSLGVFHLGTCIYKALRENSGDEAGKGFLDKTALKNTFLVACLMHDCGHAPFSHTLESFYNGEGKTGGNTAFKKMRGLFPSPDFEERVGFRPAPHEAMSAVVLRERYAAALEEFGCDPELAARMITGCLYRNSGGDPEKQIRNILIRLLNGPAIDADKLDYIMRDTWASGVKNSAVDAGRLIRSLKIAEIDGAFRLVYRKSALSVIQSVIDARNYLYEWIYNHHTVRYFSEMLRLAVSVLGAALDPDSRADGGGPLARIFSADAFEELDTRGNGEDGPLVRLVADGDILHLLKKHCPDDPPYRSYASHARRISLSGKRSRNTARLSDNTLTGSQENGVKKSCQNSSTSPRKRSFSSKAKRNAICWTSATSRSISETGAFPPLQRLSRKS